MIGAAIELPRVRRRARMSLTPLIDIVFLLLVFFMLAASFQDESRAIPLAPSGGESNEASELQPYEGAPRLVAIRPDAILLNGITMELGALADGLRPLMPTPNAVIILRPERGASLQRTVSVIDTLAAAGIPAVVLAEEETE